MKEEILTILKSLVDLNMAIERKRLELSQARMRCPHEHKERWTNNDGDGQFIVEKCLDCGLQKDGGIR